MKQKLKRLLSLALAFLLSAAALAGTAGVPAEALDVSIDTSGFHIPEPDSCYMYRWKKGLPPQPENFTTMRYPLLITWRDQYYLCVDEKFAKTLNYRYTNDGVAALLITSAVNSTMGLYKTSIREIQEFSMGKNALLSTLDSFQAYKNTGYGVVFDFMLTDIPYLCISNNEHKAYAIGIPQKKGSVAFDHEYNWLVAQRTWWGTRGITGLNVRHFSPEEFLDSKWEMPSDMPSEDGRVTGFTSVAVNLSDYDLGALTYQYTSYFTYGRFWQPEFEELSEIYPENVALMTQGTAAIGHGKNGKPISFGDMKDSVLEYMSTGISYDGSKFIVARAMAGSVSSTFQFYYGEPDLVNIYHDDFTVAKGQVVTMDGPVIIGTDCTVTVEDGGVLSCAGWVINAGEILVKPGGTLLLQDQETATGDWSYGAITNMGVNPGANCGRIACDGKMIIMRDCKLCGAGLYGLEFGEGAQVVNYGQIISENLKCKSNYTIENRGPDSAVYGGWGVTDGGYNLPRERVYGSSFTGKGTVEVVSAVYLPANAVYGEGAGRVYINGASTVAYYTPKPQKGRVSDRSVLTEGEDDNMDDGHTIDILPEPGSTAAPKPTDPAVTGPTPTPKHTPQPEETFAPYDGTMRAYIQESTGRIYTVAEDGSILWFNPEYYCFEGTLRSGAWAIVYVGDVDTSGVW